MDTTEAEFELVGKSKLSLVIGIRKKKGKENEWKWFERSQEMNGFEMVNGKVGEEEMRTVEKDNCGFSKA